LKALSLTQPWATLVAIGAKRVETRSWSTPYRGPIAIHAAKGFPRDARGVCFDDPFYDVLRRAGMIYPDTELGFSDERFLLPLGAVVAVAHLTGVCRTEEIAVLREFGFSGGLLEPHEWEFGDYSAGRFAWRLAAVQQLPRPIPCRWALGLWTVPDDVARAIADATRPVNASQETGIR
jgi:activating signal cointegrator 1